MGDELVGWIASQSIGRISYRGYKGGYGYGLFFTTTRLVGVSYKSTVSRALRPGYALTALSFSLLGALTINLGVTYPSASTDQILPLWLILSFLVMLAGMIIALAILTSSGPKQAERQIHRDAASRASNLANVQADLSVERVDVSQIVVDDFQLSILMKSGEWFLFGVQWPDALRIKSRVLEMFGRFCQQDPPISMFIDGKNILSTV